MSKPSCNGTVATLTLKNCADKPWTIRNATTKVCEGSKHHSEGMTFGQTCLRMVNANSTSTTPCISEETARSTGEVTNVGIFVQDIVLSATMFIWTIVTLAIIVSGLMRIFAWVAVKILPKPKPDLSIPWSDCSSWSAPIRSFVLFSTSPKACKISYSPL